MRLTTAILLVAPLILAHPHPHTPSSSPPALEEREGAGAQVFAAHLERLRERERSARSTNAQVDGEPSGLKKRQVVVTGEGQSVSSNSNSPEAAGYSCDPSTCVLPTCHCASASPPGGLSPKDTPQFITFTADDAVNVYTIEVLEYYLKNRTNPNGCSPKMTYFNSLSYSNYSLVTDWYVAGNEIADHTMTHVGDPPANEINGNLAALNAFSGIPLSSLKGFRAPLLQYSANMLTTLHQSGFLYDSSATSASPADSVTTDAFWPYTLDNGLANNCLDVENVCKGQLKLPGLWEVPMYAIFEPGNSTNIHLMDPWLDSTNMTAVLNWMKSTFLSHYNGNRQPFGIYSHPIHLAVGYPDLPDPIAQREMLQQFLDWAQTYQDVWFVTNQQLLSWMQDPKSNADIAQSTALGCSAPQVDANLKICNGIQQNEQGLLVQCPFIDFPWTTCYGCPVSPPTPQNPVPAQNTSLGVRAHLPTNCSTPFFDPVANQCTCSSTSCAFTDQTRPIGNYSTPLSDSNSTTPSSGTSGSTSTGNGSSGSKQTTIPRQSSGSSRLLSVAVTLVLGIVASGLILA